MAQAIDKLVAWFTICATMVYKGPLLPMADIRIAPLGESRCLFSVSYRKKDYKHH